MGKPRRRSRERAGGRMIYPQVVHNEDPGPDLSARLPHMILFTSNNASTPTNFEEKGSL